MVAEVILNYWAILVAAIAGMIIGALWYGPIFGKTWAGLMGFTEKSMKSMKMTPKTAMFLGFLTMLISSYVLAHFVDYLEVTTVTQALEAACWIWLGFQATIMMGVVLWEGKSWKLYFLNVIYQYISIAAMTIILALWA